MALRWSDKDPDEYLDYSIDWSARLSSETISSVAWTVPTGLATDNNSNTDTVATVWLSSGTAGTTYSVGCLITTSSGRIMDQSVTLIVKEK